MVAPQHLYIDHWKQHLERIMSILQYMHYVFHDGGPDHNTNQSIDLQTNSMDWFLYDRDLHHERVKVLYFNFPIITL